MIKSKTCFSKSSGEPLSEYLTREEAEESVSYQLLRYEREFYAYACRKCGSFHIAPRKSLINVVHCGCDCKDSLGRRKDLYLSVEDAEKVKRKRESEGSASLYIYPCPEREGFHLTHKKV